MYVCGITVYDYVHIGHARMLIVFDVVSRYLRHRGYRRARTCATSPTSTTRSSGGPRRTASRSAALTERFIQRHARGLRGAGHPAARRTSRAPPSSCRRSSRWCRRCSRAAMRISRRERRRHYTPWRASPATAGSPASASPTCAPARASRVDEAKRDPLDFVLWKRAKPGRAGVGVARGARAGPAGTSSARRWRRRCSARTSTCTAAAWTSSSRTTRTRSRSPARPAASTFVNLWMHNGFVQRRRGEDVEVARQLLHACARCCRRCATRKCCASSCSRASTAGRSTTPRPARAGRCHLKSHLHGAARRARRARGARRAQRALPREHGR